MEFKNGMTFFYLDTNAWNVNDPESLVVEMKVSELEGALYASAVKEGELVNFYIDQIKDNEYLKDFFFTSREEGLSVYNAKLDKTIEELNNKSKEDLLEMFFRRWQGEHVFDFREVNAMKEKIKREFGVEIR